MLVGRVVDDQVDQHAHAALMGAVGELDEVAERAEARVDVVVVGDVVAVVALRRGLERHQPDAGDAQALQVVEPAQQPLEIADAVAVGVHEVPDRQAVDDRVLVPEVVDHVGEACWRARCGVRNRAWFVTRIQSALSPRERAKQQDACRHGRRNDESHDKLRSRALDRQPKTQLIPTLVAPRRGLPGLSALVPGQQRRRHRRPRRHPAAAGLPEELGRRRGLDLADLSIADGGLRLRRRRLLRCRSRSSARSPISMRCCATRIGRGLKVILDFVPEPHVGPPSLVRRKPQLARQRVPRLLSLARPGAGRRPAEQLAQQLRRPGLDVRRGHRAVVLPRVPAAAAGPQLAQPAGARSGCTTCCASGSRAASTASGSTSSGT